MKVEYFESSQRYTAFTMVEILITISIVGVVAMLTIPAINRAVQDMEFKNAWKETFSTFNQAFTQILSENGGSFAGLCPNDSSIKSCTAGYFSKYLKLTPTTGVYTWYNYDGTDGFQLSCNSSTICPLKNLPGYFLPNGTFVYFRYLGGYDCNYSAGWSDPAFTGLGSIACTYIYIDINGFKGPNTIGRDVYMFWVTPYKLLLSARKDLDTLGYGLGREAILGK